MNHLTDDQLLLQSYGELPDEIRPEAEAHLADCAACRARFGEFELGRAGLELGMERARRQKTRPLAWAGLALAAGVAALLLFREPNGAPPADRPVWGSHLVASRAGYVTGTDFMAIDSQLIRLEQGSNNEPRN